MGIILEITENFFQKNGLLEEAIPDFEYRESQYDMAKNVATMLENGGIYIIESPTGTGKTLAYLIPAIISENRVVISTKTKNLQEQLYFKDLKLLNSYFNLNPKAIFIKGRNNYICLKKFSKLDSRKIFFDKEIEIIKKWISLTETGDLAELNEISSNRALINQICSSSETCFGVKCEFFKRCFINKLRLKAEKSDIIIVNHHLLLSDLKIKFQGFGKVLPEYKYLICDEAHSLEDVATEHFGEQISKYQLLFFAMELEEFNKQLSEKIKNIINEIFNSELKSEKNTRVNFEEFDINKLEILADNLISELNNVLEKVESEELASKAADLIYIIDKIFFDKNREYIKWVDFGFKNVIINYSPVNVSQEIGKFLANLKGVVLTSATLSISDSFDYIKSRLGVEFVEQEKIYPSNFNYKNQALFFIPEDIPEPFDKNFIDYLTDYLIKLLNLTKGNALILFTSIKNLEIVAENLKGKVEYPVFVQGESSNIDLLENFKIEKNSILLGSFSFWEGIDIEEENLKLLVIDKLPFSPPNDPVKQERIKIIRENGGNPFFEYQIPEAVMLLKQGFGRLIRSKNHKGIFALFDSRILRKNYGKIFIKNLPQMDIFYDFKKLSDKFYEKVFNKN